MKRIFKEYSNMIHLTNKTPLWDLSNCMGETPFKKSNITKHFYFKYRVVECLETNHDAPNKSSCGSFFSCSSDKKPEKVTIHNKSVLCGYNSDAGMPEICNPLSNSSGNHYGKKSCPKHVNPVVGSNFNCKDCTINSNATASFYCWRSNPSDLDKPQKTLEIFLASQLNEHASYIMLLNQYCGRYPDEPFTSFSPLVSLYQTINVSHSVLDKMFESIIPKIDMTRNIPTNALFHLELIESMRKGLYFYKNVNTTVTEEQQQRVVQFHRELLTEIENYPVSYARNGNNESETFGSLPIDTNNHKSFHILLLLCNFISNDITFPDVV
jgi:hypothetical protein